MPLFKLKRIHEEIIKGADLRVVGFAKYHDRDQRWSVRWANHIARREIS